MIFDDGFDRALWLVLSSNNNDMEKVGRVIGMLPQGVYNEIKGFIVNFKLNNDNRGEFRKSYKNIDGYDYYITVRIIADELLFNVDRWNNRDVRTEESYQLNLLSISKTEMDMMMLQNNRIGSFSYEINDNISFSNSNSLVKTANYSRDYNMFRIPFGCIMSTSLKYRLFSLKGVNYLKKMPEELYVVDFKTPRKLNMLVKSKKKR